MSAREFAAADPDHDGTLTLDEYLAVVEQRFNAANPDEDGTLNATEFKSRQGGPCCAAEIAQKSAKSRSASTRLCHEESRRSDVLVRTSKQGTCVKCEAVLPLRRRDNADDDQTYLGGPRMTWKTPKIVEVPVGMEINMYACAARK